MDKTMKQFLSKKSKFVKLENDTPVTMQILDFNEAVNQQGDLVMAYKVILNDDDTAQEKIFQSGSIRLAGKIAEMPNNGKGNVITITKSGEGFLTKYDVKLENPDGTTTDSADSRELSEDN